MSTTYPCDTCGSESATSDYCDVCGAAIDAPSAAVPAAAAAGAIPSAPATDPTGTDPGLAPPGPPAATCYFCGAPRGRDDVFCEVCGLDFISGQMPAPPPPAPPAPVVRGTTGPATPVPPGPPSVGAPSVSGVPAIASTTVMAASTGWTAVIGADRAFFDTNVTAGVVAFPDAVGPREVPLMGDELTIGRRSESRGWYPDIDLRSPVDDPAVSRRHAVLQRQADGSWAVLDEASTNGTWCNDEEDPIAHGVLRALHDGDRLLLGAFTCITIRRNGPAATASPPPPPASLTPAPPPPPPPPPPPTSLP
ncbi:MAG: hypothetical protein QOE93_1754 [Actinomycetota bacterium]|jgi:hypothetical protein|nr:hypothetical protein [Actinomycetota bacterium]